MRERYRERESERAREREKETERGTKRERARERERVAVIHMLHSQSELERNIYFSLGVLLFQTV